MTDSNFEKSLRTFVKRTPFKPFAVELASGVGFTVDHPEALALRGAVAVYIDRDGEYALFDSTGVTQLLETTGGDKRRSR